MITQQPTTERDGKPRYQMDAPPVDDDTQEHVPAEWQPDANGVVYFGPLQGMTFSQHKAIYAYFNLASAEDIDALIEHLTEARRWMQNGGAS